MLTENETAPRAQHPRHAVQGGYRVRDSAETVGDQHRIDAGILQGDLFTGQTDKLDIEVDMRGAIRRQFPGLLRRIQADQPLDQRGVVERQVAAGANANFQHNAAGEGYYLLALLGHRPGATGAIDQPGQNLSFVKAHDDSPCQTRQDYNLMMRTKIR